jgi:hypothetical protein
MISNCSCSEIRIPRTGFRWHFVSALWNVHPEPDFSVQKERVASVTTFSAASPAVKARTRTPGPAAYAEPERVTRQFASF